MFPLGAMRLLAVSFLRMALTAESLAATCATVVMPSHAPNVRTFSTSTNVFSDSAAISFARLSPLRLFPASIWLTVR